MESKVVTPRFSRAEIDQIDDLVGRGWGKNRSDVVRIATAAYIRIISERKN